MLSQAITMGDMPQNEHSWNEKAYLEGKAGHKANRSKERS